MLQIEKIPLNPPIIWGLLRNIFGYKDYTPDAALLYKAKDTFFLSTS